MKNILKRLLMLFNLEIRRRENSSPGSAKQPVGNMFSLLMDLKARGLNCRTVYDIGANKAEWSYQFKLIFPEANCVLVEPLAECEDELKKFTTRFPGSIYYLLAVGDQHEQKTITIWDDLYGSSLLPGANTEKLKTGKQREIEVVKLEDLKRLKDLPIPEIIKMDVQGFELKALKGVSSLFGFVEIFVIEVSLFSFDDVPGMPELYDVVDYMHRNDYVVYDFPGFLRRPFDGALGQCDICFVRKNSFLRSSNKW